MNAKERGIEIPVAVIVGEEVTASCYDASSLFRIRVVPFVDIESVDWYIGLA